MTTESYQRELLSEAIQDDEVKALSTVRGTIGAMGG